LKRKNTTILNKEVDMTSIAENSVKIQATSQFNPSPPSWFGESHPTRNPTVRQSVW